MNEFKFGTTSIAELGNTLTGLLDRYGITEQSYLEVYVNENEFKKIDEDLFYRTREDDSKEFVPSDGKIEVDFNNLKILINKKVEA